jgi:release factor glutamine methyltransferase
MRKAFKRVVSFFLIPATRWYLRKEREYAYHGVTVKVYPGVFHPGLFYSTRFLIDFLLTQPLQNKSLLELGCGTGLVSIICARMGAVVTASDLSKKAVENASSNIKTNQVSVDVVYSDIFENLDKKTFDWIVINPPYYARRPINEEELAWYCGEHYEYFRKLFEALPYHIHATTEVIMVLTLGSGLEKIFALGQKNGFQFEKADEREALFDGKDFLFQLRKSNSTDE